MSPSLSRLWVGAAAAAGVALTALLAPNASHPLSARSVLSLVSAAAIGLLVTLVHRGGRREKPLPVSLQQAFVLLCVAGAVVMMLVGDSLARAFGVAGAASIVRFRTPVDDPKDTILLFLLLGLGMACGMGAYGLAWSAAFFLAVTLVALDAMESERPRMMLLEVVAEKSEFPQQQVEEILTRCCHEFETRGISRGEPASAKYLVALQAASLDNLNRQLLNGGSTGIRAVNWSKAKKEASA